MKVDDMKTMALSYCMDIFADYTAREVKALPKSVQGAWRIGKDARILSQPNPTEPSVGK